MEIAKISLSQPLYAQNNKKILCKTNLTPQQADSFQLSFKGYENVIKNSVENEFKNEINAEAAFAEIMNSIMESDYTQSEGFNTLKNTYYKQGFRGLLFELWKSEQKDELRGIANCEGLSLVEDKKGKPVLSIYNLGKFDFSYTSPNNVKIVIADPNSKNIIDFGLNRKCELEVNQSNGNQTRYTKFHLTTGNRKCVVEQSVGGNPETTFYNKDGSKSFWANLFRGGVAIIQQ